MTSAKSYARAYLLATESLDAAERIAWLVVFGDRTVQRVLGKLLQRSDARVVATDLGIPNQIVSFLQVVITDSAFRRLGAIALQGQRLAVALGLGSPITLQTATVVAEELQAQLAVTLATVVPSPVVLESKTVPSLLGGFRLEYGGQQIDSSYRSRLAALRSTLAA